MSIHLSDHFSYRRMLRFSLPSVCMIVFTSIYGVVDGFFIANFVGKTAFAAVNFILPFILILGAVGFMFGTGGSAVVAHVMGKGDMKRAKRLFSLFILSALVVSLVFAVSGLVFMEDIASLLGAEGDMLSYSTRYGHIVVCAVPALVLQTAFQSFFVTAEKPKLGLLVTITAGITNALLDALLVWLIPLGVEGAALATAVSAVAGGGIPLIYFFRPNSSALQLIRPVFDMKAVWKACTNGSSEFMTNVATSVAGMVYNLQLLRYAGENGVAAYGTMLYVAWIFASVFMGYGIGVAPIIAYHDGAKNLPEVRNVLRKSLIIIRATSAGMVVISQLFAVPLCRIFLGHESDVLQMAADGFRLYSFCFLFMGIAIFGSAFFTALNNGLVSALIAVLRTLFFEIITVLLLPLLLGLTGIWLSPVLAELMAALLTALFLVLCRKTRPDSSAKTAMLHANRSA